MSMFVIAVREGPIAFDFSNELAPQAEALLAGENPYPEAIWPPLAAAVAMPFTILPSDTANLLFAVAGLACFAASLRLVGVRDWRVYGVAALWPPVIGEIRLSHLTPLLCLLVAIAWRSRAATVQPGVVLGLATGIKLFVWPLGVWMLARRRVRSVAVAVGVSLASLLIVLFFTSLDAYWRTLSQLGDTYDQDGYSIFGLAHRLGATERVAQLIAIALGAVLLGLTWQRRSFALAIAACLVLSPIVWLDYYALAAIPLAVARPTLSAAWFVPIVTWGLPSSGIAAGELSGVGRVLVVFAVILFVAARFEPREAVAT